MANDASVALIAVVLMAALPDGEGGRLLHWESASNTATAPNAIVFGSGKVCIREMARAGFVLNLIGAVVITTVCLLMLE